MSQQVIYTGNVINDFGFITIPKESKYLGSMISYNLDDYFDINLRIGKKN